MKKQTKKPSKTDLVPEAIATKEVVTNCDHQIAERIMPIRGVQVMLDCDLAKLYGVGVKQLNRQVSRLVESAKSEIVIIDPYADATILDVLSGKKAGVTVRLICRNRGKPTASEIAKFNKQYKGLTVSYSNDFHDRFVIIDNAELHNLGSSVNSLGRRVSTYSTRDAKEIKKLLSQLP